LAASGLATGASWFCYFRALKVGDAVRVAPIDKLSVVFVAVAGVALLGEHLSTRGWAGIILIAMGQPSSRWLEVEQPFCASGSFPTSR
jgi:transporter family protein